MADIFDRLAQGRPPVEEPVKQPRRNPSPIERLLDWLVNHWAKPTITAREIYTLGPRSLRDKRTALSLAQILVERGWLTPVDGHDRPYRLVRWSTFSMWVSFPAGRRSP